MEPWRNPTTLLPATTLRSLIAPQGYLLSAPFYSHLLPFSGVRQNASLSLTCIDIVLAGEVGGAESDAEAGQSGKLAEQNSHCS